VATSAATILVERVAVRNKAARSDSLLSAGIVTTFLSVIVLLPLAAVATKAFTGGSFWSEVFAADALASLRLSLIASFGVAIVNAVAGTLIAWVLVRDDFWGKPFVNALIDLPFALPTIVAGLTLVALYGPHSPVHINVAYTQAAVYLALLFVTLPFVVRSVQPVLMELDREMEEAAASLGAGILQTYARIIFPTILPALISGVALGFARSIGEFGSIVLISGNIPFKTEVAAVHVFGQIESGDIAGAATVSVVLLAVSCAVLLALNALQRRGLRHGG
jgi:sulfate/thiosulfate transport system permease protein